MQCILPGLLSSQTIQGVPKKVKIQIQIQISHNLLKYRISLSYFIPRVDNLVSLRIYCTIGYG